jgi:hypothetical protein
MERYRKFKSEPPVRYMAILAISIDTKKLSDLVDSEDELAWLGSAYADYDKKEVLE